MKTSSIVLLPLAVLGFACPAMAQAPAETILPAIIPFRPTHVKAENLTPTRPAVSPSTATGFSETSSHSRAQTVNYYLPVGAVSPWSGIRTYPGNTAAHLTNGATRVGGIPPGSTAARLAGSNGSRASRPSTKARTVSSR